MRNSTSSTLGRLLMLLALVAAGVGGGVLLFPRFVPRDAHLTAAPPAQEPATAQPPQAGPADQMAAAPNEPPTPEEEAETNAALPGGPRVSLGHAAGLHRVDDPLNLSASAAYAIELDSGKVVLQKNPDAVLPIASLTKLMTGLVVLGARQPMHETITITDEDVDRLRNSRSRLRVGTQLTRADALHLALMSSENRAAHALGRHYPGGLPAFVTAMNAKARELGMKNTRFVDPTGLGTENKSTAHDLALLAAAATRDPLMRDYSTTPQQALVSGKRTVLYRNSNRLVRSSQWDIVLQKTGYIVEAGQCLAMHARLGGEDIVMVLLDSGDRRSRWADAERIRRYVAPEEVAAQEAAARQARVAAAQERRAKAQQVAKAKADKAGKKTAAKKESAAKKEATARKADDGKRVKRTFTASKDGKKDDS